MVSELTAPFGKDRDASWVHNNRARVKGINNPGKDIPSWPSRPLAWRS